MTEPATHASRADRTAYYFRLEQVSMRKISEWDLSKRERLLLVWIVRLSFGRGRDSCTMPTLRHFCRLTALDPADVSRALRSLQSAGVVQIAGEPRGAKRYTFLPNSLLVEPDQVADPADVAACLAELEEINALGPGFEPGGQRRLEIETVEERLERDQAVASRDLALEKAEESALPDCIAAKVAQMKAKAEKAGTIYPGEGFTLSGKTEIGDSPIKGPENGISASVSSVKTRPDRAVIGDSPITESASRPPRAYAPAPARDVYVNVDTENVYVGNVAGNGDEKDDVRFALDQLQAVLPGREFDPWRRKWETRCKLAPRAIVEAVGDVKAYSQRNQVRSMGAAIFRRAQLFAKERGIQLS